MNRKRMFLFILMSILFLNSCVLGRTKSEMLNQDNGDSRADARLEQVIHAIKSQDKKALKSMFSKHALNRAVDFDENMDYLFSLFQGEVKSKISDGLLTEKSNSNGLDVQEVKSFYIVETDKEKYFFFMLEYIVNDEQPDNIGLFTLRIIKAEDEKTQYGFWQDMKIAGIYRPQATKNEKV